MIFFSRPKHFTAILLFLPLLVFSQDYKFSHIGVENGLSQSVVNCTLQDRLGFMWFGTQEGLNRYDGNNFTIYKRNPEDSNSLSNNFIYSMCEDRNGILWIGTNGGGLNSFNPATGKFIHYMNDPKDNSSISNDIVRAVLADDDGTIWLGTDGGLNRLDPATGKCTRFVNNPNDLYSLSSDNITAMTKDASGNLWIGTYGKGICMFDKASRKFFNYQITDKELNDLYSAAVVTDEKRKSQCSIVRCLLFGDATHLWIGTNGGGVEIFNTEKHIFESILFPGVGKESISNTLVLSLCDDGENNIWIASFESRIDIYNRATGHIRHYVPVEHDFYALNSSGIRTIFRDANGNMWIGTNGDGINVYFTSTSTIEHIRKSEDPSAGNNTLLSNKIMCVMEDKDDVIWMGTSGGGLTTYDRKTNKYTQHPELSTSINNSVISLLQSSDGKIWVGTYGEGLNCYDPVTKKITSYSPDNRLDDGNILCIAEEPSTHYIWFGTFGAGMYRLDPKTDSLKQFTKDSSGLSSDYIYTIFFDKSGTLWIGTRTGGVMMRDPLTGKFISYVHDDQDKNSISNNIVYCVAEDNAGDLWMSTANGLNRFDRKTKKFTTWYERDGLPSDNIYSVVPDEKGNLWLSHNKGLTRFSPSAAEGFRFKNFGPGAGVQSSEFNQGAFFSRNGELFFGGQKGLNIIDSRNVEPKQPPPPVYIISYRRFGKVIVKDTNIIYSHDLTVSWRDNNFLFELAALDYVDPSKNLFQYKLDGLDDDWSAPTTNRFVSYTNLPGGNYTLWVKAANCNGNWSEPKMLLHITVNPPFWKTNWFYSVCVIVLIGGVFGFIRYRTSAIKKENRILEAKVAERTHELAQKNADITASIEYARRIQSAILPDLSYIYRHLPESFVLYKPKDIVSGDFYWFNYNEKTGRIMLAVADCTGHGVPGALMSIIGHNLLNEIVAEKGIDEPGQVLEKLNEGVRAALKQNLHEKDTTDGMDIALLSIDRAKNEIAFAGALRPLIFIRKGLLSKIDSDRFPIGGSQDTRERKFNVHRLKVEKGDTLYMFSDGIADQFGGEKGKKFMMKRLLETLTSLQEHPVKEQAQVLDNVFETWKEGFEQVDDVLIVGIRI
ncbi:MAG TPA: two-component regulator propeller domain-containing protein [Bacteroidia bacterium]|nr:two-component regulator propeller domain-containing protein [Bacteroidia bacterium]